MSETTPLIKAALNLRVGVGFDVYEKCDIPYQTLINLYLSDCKEQNRELELKWN